MHHGNGFGTWLRDRMAEHDLTQQQVADAIGVTQQTVSKYLNNDEIPRAERVEALAGVLGVSVFDILGAVKASMTGASEYRVPDDRAAQLERLHRLADEVDRLRQLLGEC